MARQKLSDLIRFSKIFPVLRAMRRPPCLHPFGLIVGICVGVLLVSPVTAEGAEALAVITDTESAALGLLSEAALSVAVPELRLVERRAMGKLTTEAVTQAIFDADDESRFQLDAIGADGVLLLEADRVEPEAPAFVTIRLIDVRSGAVVFAREYRDFDPSQPSEDQANLIAAQVGNAIGSLGHVADLTPISLLPFRPAERGSDFVTRQRVAAVQSLLARRLSEREGLLVLERAELGRISFESLFRGAGSQTLWASARMLEGVYSPPDAAGGVRLALNLLEPGGNVEHSHEIVLEESRLVEALHDAVATFGEHLDGGEASILPGPDRLEREIQQLTAEARWHLSSRSFREAERAAFAATLLGGRDVGREAEGLLRESRLRRVSGLRYGWTQARNFGEILDSAIALAFTTDASSFSLGDCQAVLEAATRVLYYAYREGYHLSEEHGNELAQLRMKCREIVELGHSYYAALLPIDKKLHSAALAWEDTLARSGGLWHENPGASAAFRSWLMDNAPNIGSHPIRGYSHDPLFPRAPYIVPLFVDWETPFSMNSALRGWIEWESELSTGGEAFQVARAGQIRYDLRSWFVRYYKGNVVPKRSPSVALERLLLGSGILGEESSLLSRFAEFREDWLNQPDIDFYLPALFSEASAHFENPSAENSSVASILAFSIALLDRSASPLPPVYEFYFFSGREARLLSPSALDLPMPEEEFQSLLFSYQNHRKRLSAANPEVAEPLGNIAAYAEQSRIRRRIPKLAMPPESRKSSTAKTSSGENEAPSLTLDEPIHVGFPLEVASRMGQDLFFDDKLTESVQFGILGYQLGEGNRRRTLRSVDLARTSLADGTTSRTTIELPSSLFEGLQISMLYPAKLHVFKEDWIFFFAVRTTDGRRSSHLLHVDERTGEVTVREIDGSGELIVSSHLTSRGKAFLTAYTSHSSSSLAEVQGNGNIAVLRYCPDERKLRRISDSLRRPASNFLDDRPFYLIRFGGDSAGGEFQFIAEFRDPRTELSAYCSLYWDETADEWKTASSPFDDRYVRGFHVPDGSGYLQFSPDGTLLLGEGADEVLAGPHPGGRFRFPPPRFYEPPIASKKSDSGLLSRFDSNFGVTSDREVFELLVRDRPEGDEVLVLRSYLEDFSPAHHDIELVLEDLPKVNNNVTGSTEPFRGGADYPYHWSLQVWSGGITLQSRSNEQRNFYPIPLDQVRSVLSAFLEDRTAISPLVTFEPDDDDRELTRVQKMWQAALESGRGDAVEALLEEGLPKDLAFTGAGGGPLSFVAQRGDTDLLKILVAGGMDPNREVSNVRRPPLSFAIRSGHTEAVRFLLDQTRPDEVKLGPTNPPFFLQILEAGNLELLPLLSRHPEFQYSSDEARRLARALGMARAYEAALEPQ